MCVCVDGLIEVVAIGGVAHMGRLAVGLARAQRLVQCSRVTVTCHTTLPMQVCAHPTHTHTHTHTDAHKRWALGIGHIALG